MKRDYHGGAPRTRTRRIALVSRRREEADEGAWRCSGSYVRGSDYGSGLPWDRAGHPCGTIPTDHCRGGFTMRITGHLRNQAPLARHAAFIEFARGAGR
jgi:hypothetical protein